MWTFIALVVAVIALLIAKRARDEVHQLRAQMEARFAAAFLDARKEGTPAAAQQRAPTRALAAHRARDEWQQLRAQVEARFAAAFLDAGKEATPEAAKPAAPPPP